MYMCSYIKLYINKYIYIVIYIYTNKYVMKFSQTSKSKSVFNFSPFHSASVAYFLGHVSVAASGTTL